MPPEISGSDIKEKMESMRDYVQTLNEMAMAQQAGYSSLGLMLETMHKAHYSFSEFMQILEKTNVVVYTTARMINELGQNIKGATTSVEGLISAFGMLGGKVMPELVHHIGMSIKNSQLNIDAMKNEAKILQENIVHRTKSISMGDQESSIVKDLIAVRSREQEKLKELKTDIEEASSAMSKFSETMTKFLGPATLVITAAIAVAQAYDASIKAKREVIYTLGRTGISYSQNTEAMNRFNAEFTTIANRWGMLREEMAKAVAPLAALGVGGAGTVKEAAELAGGMFRGFGIGMDITVKSLGTLATAFDLKGKALGDIFLEIAGHGQKSALDMQRYITEMTSAIETTRRYGGSVESAMIMMDSFSEEIRRGTITMENITRLTTPAMWSLPQQGAVAAMMGRFAPEEARKLGITGRSLTDDILALERAAGDKNKSDELARGMDKLITGLSAGGTEGDKAVKAQLILQQLTGVQVPLLDAVKTLTDPEKLKKAMAPPITIADMKDTFDLTKTYAERTASAIEWIRNQLEGRWGKQLTREQLAETVRGREQITSEMMTKGMDTNVGIIPTGIGEYSKYMKGLKSIGGTSTVVNVGDTHIHIDGADIHASLSKAMDRHKEETLAEVKRQYDEFQVIH